MYEIVLKISGASNNTVLNGRRTNLSQLHVFKVIAIRRFTRCNLCHTIRLYYYFETKEMIYESVNMKEVVYN